MLPDSGEIDGETGDGETDAGETGDENDGHGTVRIEVSPQLDDLTVFDGTTEVRVTVHYHSCLQDFYLHTNPDMMQDQPGGAPIFAAAAFELCSIFNNVPSCQVADIEQSLLFANDVYSLKVTYLVNDPSTIAYREFRVGPLPTSEFAGCEASVELPQTGMTGYDDMGTQIWRIATLPASNVAVVDQDEPLRIEVTRSLPPP